MALPSLITKKPTSQEISNQERVDKLQSKIDSLRASRRKYEQRCYISDAFMDGEHFLGFNRVTGHLERERAPRGMANRIIHKAYRKMADMKGTIVSDSPKWMVHPEPNQDGTFSQDQLDEAMKIGDWLEDIFTRKKVQTHIHDAVFHATKHPYSVLYAYIEEGDYDGDDGDFCVDMADFYDFLCDPNVNDFQDSTILVRQWVWENDKVRHHEGWTNTDEVTVDHRWAASDWKNSRMEDKYSRINDFRQPVICSEVWEKTTVSDEVVKAVKKLDPKNPWIDEKETGDTIMHITTIAGGKMVKEEYAPFHLYPAVAYHIQDGQLLQTTPLERVASANKSLDVQVSRQEQYVAEVAVGRIKKHKNVKINRMTNEHGSYWEWDGPVDLEPRVEPMPSLPATVMQVQANTERYIDESSVYGGDIVNFMHNGRGAALVEQIRNIDTQAMDAGRKHLATALEQLAEILLMLADYYLSTPKTIKKGDGAGNFKTFKVIGARYAQEDLVKNAYPQNLRPTVLSASTKVTVTIEPGMAYTTQAKQELLMNLASMGALSVQSLLTLMKVSGNVSQELRQIMQEQGKSLIYADDFKQLSPDTQMGIINELQKLNMSMPLQPRPIGSVKRLSTSGQTPISH